LPWDGSRNPSPFSWSGKIARRKKDGLPAAAAGDVRLRLPCHTPSEVPKGLLN